MVESTEHPVSGQGGRREEKRVGATSSEERAKREQRQLYCVACALRVPDSMMYRYSMNMSLKSRFRKENEVDLKNLRT